tara:strand:+ start:583 stop:1791 length:1209 start_codon:yes stop_codon:yes gene_type:complete
MTVKLTDLKIKNLIPEDKKYKVWDAVVSGMYVLVRPSGSRMFVLRVREFNKQKEITIGAYGVWNLADARAKALEIKLAHSQGEQVSRTYAASTKAEKYKSLEDVCINWLANYKLEYPRKHRETENRMKKHLFPFFKGRTIQELKRQDIKDFITHMKRKGIEHTAIRIKQNLVHVWEDARDRELISENIIVGIKLKKPKHQHQQAELNTEKFAQILNRIDTYKYSNIHQEVGIKLMAHLFARHSELTAMKWSDIDFTKRKWEYMQTKTHDIRLVPLSKQVIALLNTLKIVGSADQSDYVFPSDVSKTGHISSFRNEFVKIVKPEEHSIHGFRAVARTFMQEDLKYSPDVIEHQLGHVVPDRLGAAYNRTKHLEDRTKMMTDWSNYLDRIKRGVKEIKLVNKDD